MSYKLIPIFEDSDADDTLPEGLEEAFQQYLNEAPQNQDGGEGDPAEGDKTDATPEPVPTDNDGNASLDDIDNHEKEQELKRKPISKKATPKVLSKVKQGTPSDWEIARAVNERKYVGMYYEEKTDHDLVLKGFRLIEPICFGIGNKAKRKDKKTGKYKYFVNNTTRKYLRAFVIRDTALDGDTKKQFKTRRKSVSKTKKVPYFRMFRVDRIQTWFAFDFVFSKYRTLYNPNDECMVKIIAALKYDEFPRGEKASY